MLASLELHVTKSWYKQHLFYIIFLAIAMSSSLYRYNLITLTANYRSYVSTLSSLYHACQPCHSHTHGTLPSDCLETRIAMMPADQTNETCRSYVGQNLGGVQSMSMVTTQSFANCERAVECQLTYLVFCIVSKPSSARG